MFAVNKWVFMFVRASCIFQTLPWKPKNFIIAMAIISSRWKEALWKIEIVSFPGMESRIARSKPSQCNNWIIVKGWKKKKMGREWYKMSQKEETRYEMREKFLCSEREPCNMYLFAKRCHTSSMMDMVSGCVDITNGWWTLAWMIKWIKWRLVGMTLRNAILIFHVSAVCFKLMGLKFSGNWLDIAATAGIRTVQLIAHDVPATYTLVFRSWRILKREETERDIVVARLFDQNFLFRNSSSEKWVFVCVCVWGGGRPSPYNCVRI
jgi:hypothetical protein